jgi:hypothetical protein
MTAAAAAAEEEEGTAAAMSSSFAGGRTMGYAEDDAIVYVSVERAGLFLLGLRRGKVGMGWERS